MFRTGSTAPTPLWWKGGARTWMSSSKIMRPEAAFLNRWRAKQPALAFIAARRASLWCTVNMIRFLFLFAIGKSHSIATSTLVPDAQIPVLHFRPPGANFMKRVLLVTSAFAFLTVHLAAATVNGKVMFLTKRGQQPVVNETLVWLEPQAKTWRPPA